MIKYYLSSNNKMCYSIKINNFSPTKQDLSYCFNNKVRPSDKYSLTHAAKLPPGSRLD